MEQVDITFCIPVFNVSGYIRDCIESILAETKDIPVEIICVDDCSNDDSWEILTEICAQRRECVRYRNESNRGVSYTRNRALEQARGEYVWFVDPDDLLGCGTVNSFLENARKQNADVILGNYARIEETFRAENRSRFREETVTFSEVEPIPHPKDAAGKTMCAIWSGMFRTAFLKENGLRFRENMVAQEDTLFYYEAEQLSPKTIITDAVCYLYRQRGSSVMNFRSEERIEKYYQSMLIMLEVYHDYLKKGTYRDEKMLKSKIHHTHENICSCLAQCTDESFVKENFKDLKKRGYYPYPFRKEALKKKGSKIRAFLDYLLPLEICFWIIHFAYSRANKRRFRKTK